MSLSGYNEIYKTAVEVAANANSPVMDTWDVTNKIAAGTGTPTNNSNVAAMLMSPGPSSVEDFKYFFNSAVRFQLQQNGNIFQNVGSPPTMTGLPQIGPGPFTPRRLPFGHGHGPQVVAQRPTGNNTRGGGGGRFQQPRQPMRPGFKASGVVYGRKPTPTMIVASNYRRNYTRKGPFQPQYEGQAQAAVWTNGDTTGIFTELNGARPLNMRSLEQYPADMMGSGSTDAGLTLNGRAGVVAKWNYAGGADDHIAGVRGPNASAAGFLLEDEVDATKGMGPTWNLGVGVGVGMSNARGNSGERFSRKVFVGGLPPDIDEEEIAASFCRFGPHVIDWPYKAEIKSYFPPKGFAFLIFMEEASVKHLIDACIQDHDKLYYCVSSPSIKDKLVQIRPWRLSDASFVLDASMPLDPRKTVFIGGLPRPLKAVDLAMMMDRLYGGVCYAGIDTNPELEYPKGAARVAFSNQLSYIAAISAKFVRLQHGDVYKRVEVKPYVLDDQLCDECGGRRSGGKFAEFFCPNVTCLQYYCEHCWATIHSRLGREWHKPLMKEGANRPRALPFRHVRLDGYRMRKKNPFYF